MPKQKSKKSVKRRPSRKASGAKIAKLPKGALTLVVMLRAKEGQHLLLEAELRALIGPTRKEEGCLQYDLHESTREPGKFLFFENWKDGEALKAHAASDHMREFGTKAAEFLGGPSKILTYSRIA